MTVHKSITSAVLALSVAAGSLVPLSSAANADGWRHHDGNRVYAGGVNRWGEVRRSPDAYEYRTEGYRHHHHDNIGGAVAVGVFATILGLALASESNRVQHQYYDNGDND